MDEYNNATLESIQQDLINQISDGEMSKEEGDAVREMFDSVNKAIAEKRKAENEKLRIEADLQRAAIEADASEKRSKRELIGNGIKTAGTVLGTALAVAVSVIEVGAILNGEDADILRNSKAWARVIKPRI